MKRYLIIAVLMVSLALAGCSSAGNPPVVAAAYEDISVETLAGMMNERRDSFLLVNTIDFHLANIPTTDHQIPFDQLENNLDILPPDKDAEIVLYCRSGNKSALAAEVLINQGYTNVKNLVGGILNWHESGLPLILEP